MKEFKKDAEKEKMPRLLSLSIWHKGAWHELLLTGDFKDDSEEDQGLGEMSSSSISEMVTN